MPDRWEFESRLTNPDGIEVYVNIAVPTSAAWIASGARRSAVEAAPPIAQAAASDAMKQITDATQEVPF